MEISQVTSQNQKNVSIGKSQNGYGFTHFAARDFREGEVVMSGFGKIIDHQTKYFSIQIKYDEHYLPTKWTGRYWNHSCDPNTHARTRADGFPDLVALRDIEKDEEINYAYWTTEFTWIKNADELKTQCLCGAKKCTGKICSFSDLSVKDQNKIRKDKLCSEYLYMQP